MLVGIAEDDEDVTFLMDMLLREQGHEVVSATDGTAAIQMCREQSPDVLLLDFTMPGELDGLGVLNQLKADPALREIPVLMLSAHTEEDRMSDCLAAGAAAFLIKPFEPEDLFDLLSQVSGP